MYLILGMEEDIPKMQRKCPMREELDKSGKQAFNFNI